ncbi:hypothetical protein SCHPADRAFT_888396 [Schizopora paradoxa]|uniref:Uncharacterized protein n=1 Tax=Schizopora paradoxa TaxID=27342 RepID=A0A0H2RVG7_9AGAM|nr:hypothetical protein SCHPADRAFT_888396 [Schizopora paradoxa]
MCQSRFLRVPRSAGRDAIEPKLVVWRTSLNTIGVFGIAILRLLFHLDVNEYDPNVNCLYLATLVPVKLRTRHSPDIEEIFMLCEVFYACFRPDTCGGLSSITKPISKTFDTASGAILQVRVCNTPHLYIYTVPGADLEKFSTPDPVRRHAFAAPCHGLRPDEVGGDKDVQRGLISALWECMPSNRIECILYARFDDLAYVVMGDLARDPTNEGGIIRVNASREVKVRGPEGVRQ